MRYQGLGLGQIHSTLLCYSRTLSLGRFVDVDIACHVNMSSCRLPTGADFAPVANDSDSQVHDAHQAVHRVHGALCVCNHWWSH